MRRLRVIHAHVDHVNTRHGTLNGTISEDYGYKMQYCPDHGLLLITRKSWAAGSEVCVGMARVASMTPAEPIPERTDAPEEPEAPKGNPPGVQVRKKK